MIYLIGKEKWKECFTFCFVRNPWDRLLSQHRYFARKNELKEKDLDFNYWASRKINFALKNDPLRRMNKHFYPACDWMKDKHGNLMLPDFVGRFENVENDFQEICEKINWKGRLKEMNIAPNKIDYREYYDTPLNELVHLFFKEDIDRFGYTFE